MDWKRWINRGVLLMAALVLSGCDDIWWLRYRLTVAVETPAGLRTGSAVHSAKLRTAEKSDLIPALAGGRGWHAGYGGEAVVVDVRPDAPPGEPRYLFALQTEVRGLNRFGRRGENLLRTLTDWDVLKRSCDTSRKPAVQCQAEVVTQMPVGTSGTVPREALPFFVTFRDLSDPRSVERVDPDDLAATFGPGVRLADVTVTLSDEEVTRGTVFRLLPWIEGYEGNLQDGRKAYTPCELDPVAPCLARGNFYLSGNRND